jgi:hypothetical protein
MEAMLTHAQQQSPKPNFFVMFERLSFGGSVQRLFASYESKMVFYREFNKIPLNARSFYEIIPPCRPVPLYLDVEWVSDNEDQEDIAQRMNSLCWHMGRALETVIEGAGEVEESDVIVTPARATNLTAPGQRTGRTASISGMLASSLRTITPP